LKNQKFIQKIPFFAVHQFSEWTQLSIKKPHIMKIYILLLFCGLMIIPFEQVAQTKDINKFYRKYKVKNNSHNITLPGWLIEIGANIARLSVDSREEKESLKLLKKVNKLKLLVIEDDNPVKDKHIDKLFDGLKRDDFEDLVFVRDEVTRVNIMIREDQYKIKNLFILVREPSDFAMVSMKTNMTIAQINKVINLMEDELDTNLN